MEIKFDNGQVVPELTGDILKEKDLVELTRLYAKYDNALALELEKEEPKTDSLKLLKNVLRSQIINVTMAKYGYTLQDGQWQKKED